MNGLPASPQARTRFGLLHAGILALGLAAALIHFTLLFPDLLFILNGLGYLGLLGAYFLPIPFFQNRRSLVRWALIGYAAITLIAWVAIGDKNWPENALGFITAAIELALIGLLLADRSN